MRLHVATAGQTECQSIKTAAMETEVHSGFEVLHKTLAANFCLSINTPGQTECQSIKTAALETEVHSGFEVLHSLNIGHTISLFAQLTGALQVRQLPCYGVDSHTEATRRQLESGDAKSWHVARKHQRWPVTTETGTGTAASAVITTAKVET